MKILIVHTFYKQKGGEDSVVFNEIDLLKSAGNDVDLLSFYNTSFTLLKLLQLPFNIASYFKTIKKIKSFKPDVVHIHNLHFAASPSIIFAVKKLKIPLVLTLHNYRLLCPSATLYYKGQIYTKSINSLFPWDAVRKGVYQNSKLITFWISVTMLLHQWLGTWKKVDKYIALGEYTKRIFESSKLSFIAPLIILKPNFCYQPQNSAGKAGDYFLFIGRLSEEKGINTLLKAFAKNGNNLTIAGTGPLQNKVLKYSKEYKNINFLGSVNKEEIISLLQNAKALIFPSEWYETFGMVIIEAFSCSKPVIASALGQLTETIIEKFNGLLFETGNVSMLNSKIEEFLNLDEKEISALHASTFSEYINKYSPEKNLKVLLNIYEQVS